MADEDWRQLAACRGKTWLFYDPPSYATAKRMCFTCPVRQVCLEDMMENEPRYFRDGVAAGMLPEERTSEYRRRLRRRRVA